MPSVAEVVAKIEKIGLVVQKNPSPRGHTMWDVVDPATGTILTGISAHADKQGGDRNWHFQIRRVLRKAGFQIEFGKDGKKKKSTGHKRKPAIDLEALKKAQDQAIAAGHRPPLLEDIEGDHDFLTRTTLGGTTPARPYSEEATGEVINAMPVGVEAPRVRATVQRLKHFMELRGPELSKRAEQRQIERIGSLRGFRPGGGVRAEFVRVAIEEVAPERGLRVWKSVDSGQQTLHSLLEKDQAGASLWVIQLLEATMDHLEGMKWNVIDLDKIKQPEPEPEISTPPQVANVVDVEGPDQTTYDVAIELIEEYEETLRLITRDAGSDGTDPDAWRALVNKSQAAHDAVFSLRKDHDEALDELAAANLHIVELQRNVELHVAGTLIENTTADMYANVLLDLLRNYKTEQQGKEMLEYIFTRLDKLAGI